MGNFFATMAASAQKNIKPLSPLEQAKLDFDKAKLNLQNAPGEVDKTEEKYIVLDKGQKKYNNLIKDRVIQKSLDVAATMSEAHKADMQEIKPFIAQYETDKR